MEKWQKGSKQKPCLKSMVKIKFKQYGQGEFLLGQDFDRSRRPTYSTSYRLGPFVYAFQCLTGKFDK